jgi:hypothetical protein
MAAADPAARTVREMPANLNVLGPPLNYEVTLEPSNRPWLFVVDATAQAPRLPGFELRQTPQLQWLTSRPLTDIVRYSASSHPDFRYGPTRASGAALIALRDDVALPAGFNPRTIALAAELRRDPALATAPAPVLVQAVLQRLRTGGYTYTLEPRGTASTRPTNSGSTASRAFASTLPRPS